MWLPLLGVGLGLVELVAGALWDVALGGRLVKAAAAVRALHVVGVLGRGRGWQVAEFSWKKSKTQVKYSLH